MTDLIKNQSIKFFVEARNAILEKVKQIKQIEKEITLILNSANIQYIYANELSKSVQNNYQTDNFDVAAGGCRIREGKHGLVVSSGRMTHRAIALSDEMVRDGMSIAVIDVFRLKPFPAKEFASLLRGSRYILVLEDNVSYGGLSDRVCSVLIDYGLCPTLSKINVGDKFVFKYSVDRTWIEKQALGEYTL